MGIKDFFRKLKKDEVVIDLGDMQKRGIYKTKEETEETKNFEKVSTEPISSSSPLGFLGSLASSSSDSDADSETGTNTTTETSSSTFISSTQKQKLKGVLRDTKEKIDSCYNKLYKITERIDVLEKKIERLERRVGV